jgi:hypothetical protein
MTQLQRTWCIRRAFEPTRFSGDQLVKVYEQLKPMQSHGLSAQSLSQPVGEEHSTAKGGER